MCLLKTLPLLLLIPPFYGYFVYCLINPLSTFPSAATVVKPSICWLTGVCVAYPCKGTSTWIILVFLMVFSFACAIPWPESFLTLAFLLGDISLSDHTFSASKLMSFKPWLSTSCFLLENSSQFRLEINGISWAPSIVETMLLSSLYYISSSAHFPVFFLVIHTHMFLTGNVSKCPLCYCRAGDFKHFKMRDR